MSWMLVGAAAVSVVGSAYGASEAKKKAKKQVSKENSERATANLANAVRGTYRAGLLNLQEGQYKKSAIQQGFDMSVAGADALGKVSANAAASGTVGASVDAVLNDVEQRVGEALAQQVDVAEVVQFNFDVQREEIQSEVERGQYQMVTADLQSDKDIYKNALISGALTAGSMYTSSQMSLGPGKSPSSGGSDRVALQRASTQFQYD